MKNINEMFNFTIKYLQHVKFQQNTEKFTLTETDI